MTLRVAIAIVGATVIGIGSFVGKKQILDAHIPPGMDTEAAADSTPSYQTAEARFGGMSTSGFGNKNAPASVTGSKGAKFVSSGKPKPAPAPKIDQIDAAIIDLMEQKAKQGEIPDSLFQAMKSQIESGYSSLIKN